MGREFSTHSVIDFIRSRSHYARHYERELNSIIALTNKDKVHAEQTLHSAIGRYLLELPNIIRKIDSIESENVHGTVTEKLAYWEKIR
ncbi:MAG: hypothetical protein PHE49_06265 [bacterium]|nr:hypothetical protein [bacterium]